MGNKKSEKAVNKAFKEIAAQYPGCREAIQKVTDLLPDKLDAMREITAIFHYVITNSELDQAEKIRSTVFMKLPNGSRILGSLTVGEIRSVIARKNFGSDFFSKLLIQIENLQKIKKAIDYFNKTVKIIYSLVAINQIGTNDKQAKDSEDEARQKISGMERAYEQMKLFMDIVEVINSFSPKGVKDYINYQIKFFKKLETTMNICKNHSLRILKLLREIERLEDAVKNPSSYWNQWLENRRRN